MWIGDSPAKFTFDKLNSKQNLPATRNIFFQANRRQRSTVVEERQTHDMQIEAKTVARSVIARELTKSF